MNPVSMNAQSPDPTDSTPSSEPDFYRDLFDSGATVVPVVGSGLTVEAKVPSFAALVKGLVEAALAAEVGLPTDLPDDYFDLADVLAARTSEEWLQTHVANIVGAMQPEPSPALLAISKVRSGIVVTTNYDMAIEVAAAAVGRPVRTLTSTDLADLLQPPSDELRVLHLHGVCTDPASIVLSTATYDRLDTDEKVELALRVLATQYRLVFLGHNLAPKEAHIRRNVDWAVAASAGGPLGRHVLITDQRSMDEDSAVAFRGELERNSQVLVRAFDDPGRAFEASKRAAFVLAGPANDPTNVAQVPPELFDTHYVPLPVGATSEIEESGGPSMFHALLWQDQVRRTTDLDNSVARLALIAGGGLGKSQELLQIGRRSTRPALYQPLNGWEVDTDWADPASKFLAVMNGATAAAPNAGSHELSIQRLRDESFVFLLDGLDEVSEVRRARVIQLLNQVAALFPQHRYVLATRPLPLVDDLTGFEHYTPVPDGTWLNEYCVKRGLTPSKLEAALPESGGLDDLIRIPLFAAAAINLIQAGKQLPETGIQLVWRLTEDQMAGDNRVSVNKDELRCWLDRLALLFELAETVSVSAVLLPASGLHTDLGSIVPTSDFILALATRALLTESDGEVRFPANVVGEARAGRALLNGTDGLGVLCERVLVELDALDGKGDRVRAVRQSWFNTLEMLLAAAPEEWRSTVAAYDPALAARSTPNNAQACERHAAIWSIWSIYLDRRVWMSRTRESHGSGDSDALHRLLKLGAPEGFEAEIVRALDDPEPTVRGNAMQMVPVLFDRDRARPHVQKALTDVEGVVRRQAASAALDLEAVELAQAMVDQAHIDDDPMARQTLVDFAIELSTPEQATSIALEAPAAVQDRAFSSLMRKVPRAHLLEHLKNAEVLNHGLLRTLVQDHGILRTLPAWTQTEVAALVDIIVENPVLDALDSDAERILRQHPLTAVLTWIRHPVVGDISWQFRHTMIGVRDQDLVALRDVLSEPTAEAASALAGHDDTREFDDSARLQAIDYLDQVLAARARTPPADDLPASRPYQHEARPVAMPELNDHELSAVFENDGVGSGINSQTGTVSRITVQQLEAGAKRGSPLTAEQCEQLLRFLLAWHDQHLAEWLAVHWSSEALLLAYQRIGGATDTELRELAIVLPEPWPLGLHKRILDAAAAPELTDRARLQLAENVRLRVGLDAVREWAAETSPPWLDPLLAANGDCGAELRLIAQLQERPESITRHPSSTDSGWIDSLACRGSAEALQELIRHALTSGTSFDDTDALYRALNRCSGLDGPRLWDELINNPSVPSGNFCFYPRRDGIDLLIREHAPVATTVPAAADPELQHVAVQTVQVRVDG